MTKPGKTVEKVKDEAHKWANLRAALEEEAPDLRTLLDTLEGETELHEAIEAIVVEMEDTKALIYGLDIHIENLANRANRMKTKVDRLRAVILYAFEKAGIPNIKLPIATVSRRLTPAKVVINDEFKIPRKFFEPQPPKLSKKKVLDALKGGEKVDGAVLGNPAYTISVRMK